MITSFKLKVSVIYYLPILSWTHTSPFLSACFLCIFFVSSIILTLAENDRRGASIESSSFGPLDARATNGNLNNVAVPFHVSENWLAAINEYKNVLSYMLAGLHASLSTVFKSYETQATDRQLESFLTDESLRDDFIAERQEESFHSMRSETLLFWEQYKIRILNFERLKLDLEDIDNLFDDAGDSEACNTTVKEYIIAKNGDSILEFVNRTTQRPSHQFIRFRVSSHLLSEASPLFAQFLSPQRIQEETPYEMIGQLPPPPSKYKCKDGSEIKLYRMPQVEFNENDALTILLQAAHMHHSKVPREVDFPLFVSIAEVCLRYNCTSPLELQVEYQWLPQWIHMISDENIDGFLLISYTFGLRRIFTRMSKSTILNVANEEELQAKSSWPKAVRDKIHATRSAKVAQVYECCRNAANAFFRPPAKTIDQGMGGELMRLTSKPRCPKGSHICDATNLGWIMLALNELQLLSEFMKDSSSCETLSPPKRSLKELVDCLRLIPSPPGIHSGICDYITVFRSDINDIYNSVVGLTLRDVSGKNGWALSKHAGATEDRFDDLPRDQNELEAPMEYANSRTVAMSNEDINIRILSNLNDLDDLVSAAMIDKSFYRAYKQNEAVLLKNMIKETERKNTMSLLLANSEVPGFARVEGKNDEQKSLVSEVSHENDKFVVESGDGESLLDGESGDEDDDEDEEAPMTEEEAARILWPEQEDANVDEVREEATEKCLMGDTPPVENKIRTVDDEKMLGVEKDKALGLGSGGVI